ncbi:MAG TPA: substrate-binding domain-containing protein [Candidatus Dormibacteraeota bacterium]|nr:substrate-binding domain-containing protein [Candidatus Dormibacteraeota bacterium]
MHMNVARWRVGVTAAALLGLIGAACSTANAPTSSTGGNQSCKSASSLQAQLVQTWHRDQAELGVPQMAPPAQQICMVDTSKFKKPGPYHIAFASQGPTNSWAVEYDAALKHEAQTLGIDVLYASANGDAATQVQNLQDLLIQKPDALVVTPMGSAIEGQLHRYAQQGIPVVVCTGQLSDTQDFVTTVNRSYALQGSLWAEWVAKQIGYKGDVAMLSGIAGVPTAEYEYQAAKQVFARYPNIHIVTHQYDDWSPTKAKQVADTLAVNYPHLNAVWTDSGFSAIGVIQAYSAAHLPIPPVTGDTSNGFLRLAKQYNVTFATSPYPPEQSAKCLDAANQILQGKSVPSYIEYDAPVFTNKDVDKYFRPQCSDSLWIPAQLPDSVLKSLNLC